MRPVLHDPALVHDEDRSARRIVESRWAIMKLVRPHISRSRASRITASVLESIDEVGSSRIRIGASLRKARATQIRCRSPPESWAPRSPISVWYCLRKPTDEVVGVGVAGRLDDLFIGGLQPAVADVLGNRAREQQGLLQDQADLIAERTQGEFAGVNVVQKDPPALGIVKTGNKADERGLARAVGPTMATVWPGSTSKETSLSVSMRPS